MVYQRLHCWDCGQQIVEQRGAQYIPMPHLREVIFDNSDGSYMQSPFCQGCAERVWTPERLAEFKRATDEAAGAMRPFTIVRAAAVKPVTGIIQGVLS